MNLLCHLQQGLCILTLFSCALRCCLARRLHRHYKQQHEQLQHQRRLKAAAAVAAAWRRHVTMKRARLQLRMLRDARDMKQVVPSSRTSRIANLKKLPLTERGLKNNSPLPQLGAKVKEAAAAAAGNAAQSVTTSTGRPVLQGKALEKQKYLTRQTPSVTVTPSVASSSGKHGGGVGVGIVFAHDSEGVDDVLSVKQFVK